MKGDFKKGIIGAVPIALGYLSVSFGFGIIAVRAGLSVFEAVAISVTNLTSAGQAAGVGIIAAGGTYIEMALTQLIINIRYALMGLSLSQKLDESFDFKNRLFTSFGITDEIFAVASSEKGKISAPYLYGLIFISFLGWSAGTFLGAAAGKILPEMLINSMGIVLYAMFLAIIIPPSKKSRGILAAVCIAAALSLLFKYAIRGISSGFVIIICAVSAALICAALFPVNIVENEEEAE